MSSRANFRPKPVDIARSLSIVRDISELDHADQVVGHSEGAAPNAQPAGASVDPQDPPILTPPAPTKKKPKPKEIPVPDVKVVPMYTREYLPLYQVPDTYIRGRGGTGWVKEEHVEYDLDNEDEDWLAAYNARASASTAVNGASSSSSSTGCLQQALGCGVYTSLSSPSSLLSDAKFEKLLWKLDIACAMANERAMAAAGASDKSTHASAASTSHLSKEEAMALIRRTVGGREQVLVDVYQYWLSKRKRYSRPLLRRLQVPTSLLDVNPLNTFRVREKTNRPLTRRRRENSVDCLEKMRLLRENLLGGLEMGELVILRERKKREAMHLDVGLQRFQLSMHHGDPQLQRSYQEAASQLLQESMTRNAQCELRQRAIVDALEAADQEVAAAAHGAAGGSAAGLIESPFRQLILRKRKRKQMLDALSVNRVHKDVISKLPPPPQQPPDQELLFVMRPDPDRLPASAVSPLLQSDPSLLPPAKRRECWRVCRGGRLQLVRVDPLTMQPAYQDHGEGDSDGDNCSSPNTAAGSQHNSHHVLSSSLVSAGIGGAVTCTASKVQQQQQHRLKGHPGGAGRRSGVGDVTNWWSHNLHTGTSSNSSSSTSTLWADRFDMSHVPYLVDTDALVLQRHVQLQKRYADRVTLGALSEATGNCSVGPLGAISTASLVTASQHAAVNAHTELQQWLATKMAADVAALGRRKLQLVVVDLEESTVEGAAARGSGSGEGTDQQGVGSRGKESDAGAASASGVVSTDGSKQDKQAPNSGSNGPSAGVDNSCNIDQVTVHSSMMNGVLGGNESNSANTFGLLSNKADVVDPHYTLGSGGAELPMTKAVLKADPQQTVPMEH
ncbi:hypothetical protein CEUSTIGMA_g7890.t1 [Chlamydomonas eustigma]|uniref:Enhancer of polycomb-like protein n=1 Tax=Chlamydomonas eustigma TaxID=1157962 RepID=A0A250XBI7_9CHLO|nr:hypothetical protein CEUSTIGMA_g7890.t1 [Chlamydomonas eustigma]|eukprot:GAX80451.1 hypothetical protein CEUSTIGMA_g7890.t1 [Chlamydomonas eustigma]